MKTVLAAFAGALLLAACSNTGTTATTAPVPSGGSAGTMGPGYCEKVPTDPYAQADWNRLCMPGRR